MNIITDTKFRKAFILAFIVANITIFIAFFVIRGCAVGHGNGSSPSPECSTEKEVRKVSCPSGQSPIGQNPLQICTNGKWVYSFPADGDLSKVCKASACSQQTFDKGVQALLTQKCVSCHPGYDKFATAKGKADAFIARTSLGDNENGRMPKAPNQPLSASEKALFTDWKKDGLLETCPGDTTTNIPFQNFNALELSLTKDIGTQSPGLQAETRWLVLVNHTNEGTNAKQFATFQAAIQKGINQISSGRSIVLAAPGDSFGTAFRFNLNDLKLTNAAWTLIENADPINLESFTNLGTTLKNITKTRKPWLFASAFAVASNTSAVYNAIHKIPADLNTFLGQVGVNENTQLANFQAIQLGLNTSPISLNKGRLIARFDSNDGALYQTFDTDQTQVSADRNFSKFPLLKSASGKATAKFDASEILNHLPNGLLESSLWDAKGNNLSAASLNIVSFNVHPPADGTIKNAQSCLQCHSGGLIPKKDEIGAQFIANGAQHDSADVDLVTQLFRDPAKAFADDNATVGVALSKMGILASDPDPLTLVLQNLTERNLDAKAVASLLFLTETDFKSGLATRSPQGLQQVGQLITGGTVTFVELQPVLATLIKDLRVNQEPLNQ